MGLSRKISAISGLLSLVVPALAAAEGPICTQEGWKSLDAKGKVQAGCEKLDYATLLGHKLRVTDFKGTAAKDLAAALHDLAKKGFAKGDELAKTLETAPYTNGAFKGDGQLDTLVREDLTADIRAGYIPQSKTVPCKGNILFMEGLSDSIQNHERLFSFLSGLGYRVIAFDYMGQGGSRKDNSDLSADNVRVEDLPELGQQIYERYRSPACKKKILLGWSTGGLAAYYWAADRYTDEQSIERQIDKKADDVEKGAISEIPGPLQKIAADEIRKLGKTIAAKIPAPDKIFSMLPRGPKIGNAGIDGIILLAPALAVRTVPGKSTATGVTEITADTQTPSPERQKAFVDAPFPSAVVDVPTLAGDILVNSVVSRAVFYEPVPAVSVGFGKMKVNLQDPKVLGKEIRLAAWTVPANIKGMIMLSSNEDKYVDSETLVKEIPTKDSQGMAPGLDWYSLQDDPALDPRAYHGLDNERDPIWEKVKSAIKATLLKISKP